MLQRLVHAFDRRPPPPPEPKPAEERIQLHQCFV